MLAPAAGANDRHALKQQEFGAAALTRIQSLQAPPRSFMQVKQVQDKDAQTLMELRDKLEMNGAYLGMVRCAIVQSARGFGVAVLRLPQHTVLRTHQQPTTSPTEKYTTTPDTIPTNMHAAPAAAADDGHEPAPLAADPG